MLSYKKLSSGRKLIFFIIILVLISLGLGSCNLSPAEPTATVEPPTVIPSSTITLTATATPLPPTATNTPTLTFTPTNTVTPFSTMTKSVPESIYSREDFDFLVELHDQGLITSDLAKYRQLDDFHESWAQLNYYIWWPTTMKPENFVVRADASWKSASRSATWIQSGCGFVFSDTSESNHNAVFLTMDGKVRTHKYKNGVYYGQQTGYYGRFDVPEDSAEITLIVEDQWMTVLVNGEKVLRYEDAYIQKGGFAFSLLSGTNKDYGTDCLMENIEFWDLRGSQEE